MPTPIKHYQLRRKHPGRLWTTVGAMIIFMLVFKNMLWIRCFYYRPRLPRISSDTNDVIETQDEVSDLLPEAGKRSERNAVMIKWMVVHSRAGCDVEHLTLIPGWSIVVTGSPPRNCEPPACVYMDNETEKSLGLQMSSLLLGDSDSRKMIGYLYAIVHRADVIYDLDCDVIPKFNKVGFSLSGATSGLAFNGSLFNPYGHFGYPMLTPRGFPDTKVKGQGHFRIVDVETPVIQQGQINFIFGKHESGIFKLAKDINVTLDRSSPPVYLSRSSFAPVNSQNTLFLRPAFWALFLPKTPELDGDIVRGYIAQRLLSETGGHVGFVPPTAYCLASSAKIRFISNPNDSKYSKLIHSLTKWKCVSKQSFFGCAKDLIEYLVKHGVGGQTAKLYEVWVSDLRKAGYKEPPRTVEEIEARGDWGNPDVIYSSPKVIPLEVIFHKGQTSSGISDNVFNKLQKMCPGQKQTLPMWINPPITDIMLVVIFNYEFLFKNLPYIEFTQRVYFRHILYCGPSFEGFEKVQKQTNLHHLIYINGVDKDTWFFTYQCLTYAANMKLNVKGYLYIGDDILLNSWNIVDLPRDKFWMPTSMTYVDRNQVKHPWWYYWQKPVGRTAANGVMDELQDIAKTNPEDKMVVDFLSTYDRNVNLSRVIHRSIDIFYAPARFNAEIVRFGRIFRKHKTLLGLAVPMLHAGLVELKDVVHLKGKSLWKGDRSQNINSFKEDNHYVHPFKAGKDLENEEGKSFFCKTYMTLLTRKIAEVRSRSKRSKFLHIN